jgi:hypothetical protein
MWFGALCELAELFRHTWEEGWLAVELLLSFFPCKRAIGLPATSLRSMYALWVLRGDKVTEEDELFFPSFVCFRGLACFISQPTKKGALRFLTLTFEYARVNHCKFQLFIYLTIFQEHHFDKI